MDEHDEQTQVIDEAVQDEADETDHEGTSGFDPRWREPFEGLVYLGHLESEVDFAGHRFVVRTLKTGEKLEALQICRPYEDSISFARAYRAAIAAAGLVSVDGMPIIVPHKGISLVRQKYDYITQNWYDIVIEQLYLEIDRLEGQVVKIMEELGVVPSREEVVTLDEAEGVGEPNASAGQSD